MQLKPCLLLPASKVHICGRGFSNSSKHVNTRKLKRLQQYLPARRIAIRESFRMHAHELKLSYPVRQTLVAVNAQRQESAAITNRPNASGGEPSTGPQLSTRSPSAR